MTSGTFQGNNLLATFFTDQFEYHSTVSRSIAGRSLIDLMMSVCRSLPSDSSGDGNGYGYSDKVIIFETIFFGQRP